MAMKPSPPPQQRLGSTAAPYRNPFLVLSILLFYALIQCFDLPDDQQRQFLGADNQKTIVPTRVGILGRLLRDAGIDSATLSSREVSLLDEKIVQLYGQSPVIAGTEDCPRYRHTIPRGQRQLAVAGMFNTGTNLLDNQLRKNILGLSSKSLWQVPWGKHRMATVKETHVAPNMETIDKRNILPILVIRHPVAWLQSMCAHPYAAHWHHDKNHCPNFVSDVVVLDHTQSFPVTIKFDDTDQVTFDSLIHLWNEWYRQYLESNDPLLIVRYEDLVFQPHLVLSEIAQCVEATVRLPLEYQTKTAKSHGSGTDLIAGIQKTANLNPSKVLKHPKDYEYFAKHVDTDLMTMFHYYQ